MKKRYNTNPAYNQYINSKEWRAKRQEAFKARGKACEMCGSKDILHVHHVNYDRFGGKELMSDLCILCESCHMEIHGIRGKKKANGKKGLPYYRRMAIQHLGIPKSGGKGWVSLAKKIVQARGMRPCFNGKDHARKYVKSAISKFE